MSILGKSTSKQVLVLLEKEYEQELVGASTRVNYIFVIENGGKINAYIKYKYSKEMNTIQSELMNYEIINYENISKKEIERISMRNVTRLYLEQ